MVQQIIPDGQHVQDLILNGIMLQRTGRTVLKIFQVKSLISHLRIQIIISCCDSTIMVKVFIIFLDTTEAPTTAAPPAAETTPGGMRMSIIHIATSLIIVQKCILRQHYIYILR